MTTYALGVKLGSLDLRAGDDLVELERVDYVESIEELDAVTAEFSLPGDHVTATWSKVQPGTAYTVEFLKRDDASVVASAKGLVVEVSIEKVGFDRYRFTVVGLEELVKLRGSSPEVAWEDAPDKIAKAIASAAGFTPSAEGSNVVKYRADQGALDDLAFLKTLGDRFGYRVGVADGKLEFKRRSTVSGTVDVAEEALLDARLRISVHDMVTEVTVWGRDPKQNGWFSEKVTDTGTGISGTTKGITLAKKVYKAAALTLRDAGCTTPGAAQERATAELKLRADRFVEGTIEVVGNPDVRIGADVNLKDSAWPFKGKYRVRQARHREDRVGGYRTVVDVYSDSLPATT